MKEKLNCIMMIDDDEPTNFMSTVLFEEADCTRNLMIVDGGLKALNYFENTKPCEEEKDHFIPPDLVFLDINMPCMSGWEFLDEYKKLGNNGHKKAVIIMLTTSLNPEDKYRAEANPDVAGFENKPLTTEMIQRVLNTYFNPTGSSTQHN